MIRRRSTLGWAAAVAAGPLRAQAPPFDDVLWHDDRRQRAIPLRLRWPAGDAAAAIVLFSHGLGGDRAGAERWGQAWQQAGLLVVHLQHPGSDIEVFRQGAVALRRAASAEQLLARADDVRFVLDRVDALRQQREGPWSRCVGQPVGLAGHSFGAVTTLAVAGQRYPVPASLADARPAAFVALSPAAANERMPLADAYGAIRRPLLLATGSHDGDPFGSFDGGEPRARLYEGLPAGQRALLWLDGADHMSFSGNSRAMRERSGLLRRHEMAVAREAQHQQAIVAATTTWWRAHLQGDASSAAALRRGPPLAAGDRWQTD